MKSDRRAKEICPALSICARLVRIGREGTHRLETMMKRYLLSIYQPGDGSPPPPEVLQPIMQAIHALHEEMKDVGALVFTGGLHPPSTATVLQAKGGQVLVTDGPYIESKEHLGGFTIIQADDLDAALNWARRLAAAVTLPIEVRPFHESAG